MEASSAQHFQGAARFSLEYHLAVCGHETISLTLTHTTTAQRH
jgi:hypothetical protein